MAIIETTDSGYLIPIEHFDTCLIKGAPKSQIVEMYPRRADGAYYLNKFINFLKDNYGMDMKTYCKVHLKIEWPKCPITKEETGFRVNGKGLTISKFKSGSGRTKENCPAFKLACDKISVERMGARNPMFGKTPWNEGKTYELPHTHGRKITEEHRSKLKKARSDSPLKARHTQKHSEASKELMRNATINRWKNGDFSFRETGIETKVKNLIKELNLHEDLKYQLEVGPFVCDFGSLDKKLAIECMGDWFHCNPQIPKFAARYPVQFRNLKRDELKREYLKKNGWSLIELWETDINSGEYKDFLICKLKELSMLKK